MDVVKNVQGCLSRWKSGGEDECRKFLINPHCNPLDPSCADVLATAYETLLSATLTTRPPKHSLSTDAFVAFVQSVLEHLPSTSSSSATRLSNISAFGEHLVDIIWSLDAELDDILAEAKAVIAACEQNGDNASTLMGKAAKARQSVEADKATISSTAKRLLELGILNPTFCRERLDSATLESVGLIPDKTNLDKREIRTRTALFYKQNKFNLLREQSEGYSKLTVELTSNLGSAHSSATGRPTENCEAILERVRPVWEKIISLIGYFDLDPNKALDIILDVMSVHLATHYTFFTALLYLSPWTQLDQWKNAPTRDEVTSMDSTPSPYQGKSLDEVLSLADRSSGSSSTAKKGSSVLAQVLGFKFAHYQSPEVQEQPPKSLYLTAAILIRERFIELEDLYPHLSPADDDMEKAHDAYKKDVQNRIQGAKISQLAMAAPLESGGTTSKPKAPAPTEQKKSAEPKDPPNQKAGLVGALLAVGAFKPAVAILTKFKWLVDAHPELADLLIRVLKHSLNPLYTAHFVPKGQSTFSAPRSRYGTTGLVAPSARKHVLTLWAPIPPSTQNTDFVFFYPDWDECVPLCTNLTDLVDVIEPLMRFVGLHIYRDTTFITKMTRLGHKQLATTVPMDPVTKTQTAEPDPEDPIRVFWFKILRLYLLPALPLIRGNAVCPVDIWNVIRSYEVTARWRLYGEWRSSTYKSHPELRIREVQADRESKGILRRLSLNTIDSLSGPVAKLVHSNPCIFFTNCVNQVMAYDNLANVVIQALKYVTNFGFDTLVFIVLDALSNPNKERVKDDGVNTSDWLQSLASFAGMVFRRFGTNLTPYITYIVHQLQAGQTTEIVVLRELIWKMAGIEPLPSLSDSQIAAMAGGPTLRIEAIASGIRGARQEPGDATLRAPYRLGKALLEGSLALPLLIQVAQQRQSAVFLARDAHVKSLASLYDTTHGVLLQYLELLTTPAVISPQDYANKILPPLGDLGEKYGISAPICMQIIRPVLHTQLLETALKLAEEERKSNEEAEKRLKAALTAKREPSTSVSTSRVASPSLANATETPSDGKVNPPDNGNGEDVSMEPESKPIPESPWLPQLSVLFDEVKKVIPPHVYEVLGPGFYLTFWQLSTYDLSPPGSKYDEEVASLRSLIASEPRRMRRDRYTSFVSMLTQEFKEQTVSRAFTLKRLAREKQHWFPYGLKKPHALLDVLIEHCIQPRCLLSPMDADFCAQFVKVMHTQGTPGFYTLACYDKVLGDPVKVILFSCSEYEARNYGRFLLGILTDLSKWHQDEQVYIQDNRSKVGGKTVLHAGLQLKYQLPMPPENQLKWREFRTVVRKWHKKLANAFTESIQTREYMHVYNAIIVLKEILPVFPLSAVYQDGGLQLDRAMDQFLEKEERGDLKILGRAYSASLKKRENLWAASKPAAKPIVNAPTAPSPKPSTPTNVPEKPRAAAAVPIGPSAQNGDKRVTPNTPAVSAPSAPRAQLANTAKTPQAPAEKPPVNGSTTAPSVNRSAMESVPRPPVVKRVRQETGRPESPKPALDKPAFPETAKPSASEKQDASAAAANEPPPINARVGTIKDASASGSPLPQSPRGPRHTDDKPQTVDAQPAMPPPTAPSQTHSAQELRETAKQSINRTDRLEKGEDKTSRPATEPRSQNGSAAPSPHGRSPSPPSRPGTRNHSSDSRTSGGRSRSERANVEVEEKRSDREHTGPVRRDSLTHSRTDRARDRSEGEREKDRDSRRDRHGDRERERDRDRDRERERDRDKDRDRERDRDRHGDRHRRDDKDRERERERKERDSGRSQNPANSNPSEDRSIPQRPDTSRHRNGTEENLGKRRRGPDDEFERGSKRGSRKDAHREDRSRRPGDKDKDTHRESDRRRRERDDDSRGASGDKAGDKRSDTTSTPSTKTPLPATTPSAPRAMSSTDTQRKSDSGAGRGHRDPPAGPTTGSNTVLVDGGSSGSLRSRIGDKSDVPPARPQGPQSGSSPWKDERDGRKRTFGDREKDSGEGAGLDQAVPKRPRLIRNRYQSGEMNFARRALNMDTSPDKSSDKGRRRD
ncbi:tho2 protein [Moniliophthora roreri MCA 2997]|uniref:THO complex subunit 2 n=1 Tax=Moniliophthora roreri (strain MCA 2997) TaxID=1381753 RepID=V2XJ27_MONRO|nr:tho2 protein [Moniliophthora roreri MCA 2997]